MRKELCLCDHCGKEIERSPDGKEVYALKIEGSAAISGTVTDGPCLTKSIQGRIGIIKSGEYCSKRCLLAAVRKSVETAEERLHESLR
jgi:hypothetical protein